MKKKTKQHTLKVTFMFVCYLNFKYNIFSCVCVKQTLQGNIFVKHHFLSY